MKGSTKSRKIAFRQLFGYILGNRDGIDNWHLIPAPLRRSLGRQLAPVRSSSGEKKSRGPHQPALQAPGTQLASAGR